MRTIIILLLLGAFAYSGAMFKDLRKGLKPVASPTQQEMEHQQSLQRSQGTIGGVPDKTDDTGYSSDTQSDPQAGQIVAQHAANSDSSSAAQVLQSNEDNLQAEKQRPARTLYGGLWALLAGLLIAGGAWAALQKYGPKPPPHLAK